MKCPNCAYENAEDALSCNLCQNVLKREKPAPAPAPSNPAAGNPAKLDSPAAVKSLMLLAMNELNAERFDEAKRIMSRVFLECGLADCQAYVQGTGEVWIEEAREPNYPAAAAKKLLAEAAALVGQGRFQESGPILQGMLGLGGSKNNMFLLMVMGIQGALAAGGRKAAPAAGPAPGEPKELDSPEAVQTIMKLAVAATEKQDVDEAQRLMTRIFHDCALGDCKKLVEIGADAVLASIKDAAFPKDQFKLLVAVAGEGLLKGKFIDALEPLEQCVAMTQQAGATNFSFPLLVLGVKGQAKEEYHAEYKKLTDQGVKAMVNPARRAEADECFRKAIALLPRWASRDDQVKFRGRLESMISAAPAAAPAPQAQPVMAPRSEGKSGEYAPGEFIGGTYLVQAVLGRGGCGVVYKAHDKTTDCPCALKTFLDQFMTDAKVRDQFRKEAQLWVDLGDHPYLVRARVVHEYQGRLYLDMELIAPLDGAGNSLEGRLRRPVDSAQALRWAVQFCHGIEHAYAKGVKAHRDIKPGNIMVDRDGTLKISDFGLAALRAALPGREGASGTPAFMPPEQWIDMSRCDHRSDQYSFGVVLYMLACGKPPFSAPPPAADTADEWRRYMGELRRLHDGAPVPALNSPLFPAISRCLEKDPARRWSGFPELRAQLEALLKQATGETIPAPAPEVLGAADWNNKGVSLASLHKPKEALECYDKGLALDPNNAKLWNNKGNALGDLDFNEEAVACFDKAISLEPRYAAAWGDKGIHLQNLKRYDDALKCYERAETLEPLLAQHLDNKGCCLDAMERLDEAVACFERALAIDPRRAHTWHNKGNSLRYMDGRMNEAIAAFRQAVALDPMGKHSWIELGQCLGMTGKPAEALAALDKVLALDPKDAGAWSDKSAALDDLKRSQEAVDAARKAVELDPKLARGWRNMGTALTSLNSLPEAAAALQKAAELAPDRIPFVKDYCLALQRVGRLADALPVSLKLAELAPDDLDARYMAAGSLWAFSRAQEALPHLDACLKHPELKGRMAAAAWLTKGDCLRFLDRFEEALPCYANALAADPTFKAAADAAVACRNRQKPA